MKITELKNGDLFRWGSQLWRFIEVLPGRSFSGDKISRSMAVNDCGGINIGEIAQLVGDIEVQKVHVVDRLEFPYRLTVWRAGYYELARFRGFDLALECYRNLRDETKQLTNVELACDGKDGLTEEQRASLLLAT